MSNYFDLTIHIFDEPPQHISALQGLTGQELVEAVLAEFPDLDSSHAERYGLFLKGQTHPLPLSASLRQLNIQSGDHLAFNWLRQPDLSRVARSVAPDVDAILIEKREGRRFDVHHLPFIIGRGALQDEGQLGADLRGFPNEERVSRRHACLTERDGSFFIEPLAPRNPILLNGETLAHGRQHPLQSGDLIELGSSGIILEFFYRKNQK